MTGKLFLAGALLGYGALAVALLHCSSGTVCDSANSMLTGCNTQIPQSSSASSGGGAGSSSPVFDSMNCTGAAACKANCVENFSCAQINGNDPNYVTCLNNCNGL